MSSDLMTLNVMGPYREPKEPAFSLDYSVQRPNWATPQGVRIKVSIEHELEHLKQKVLGISGGSVGQQLRMNQMLIRAIADRKLEIVDAEGMLNERLDVMISPFAEGDLSHLFAPLTEWMQQEKDRLRNMIKDSIGI